MAGFGEFLPWELCGPSTLTDEQNTSQGGHQGWWQGITVQAAACLNIVTERLGFQQPWESSCTDPEESFRQASPSSASQPKVSPPGKTLKRSRTPREENFPNANCPGACPTETGLRAGPEGCADSPHGGAIRHPVASTSDSSTHKRSAVFSDGIERPQKRRRACAARNGASQETFGKNPQPKKTAGTRKSRASRRRRQRQLPRTSFQELPTAGCSTPELKQQVSRQAEAATTETSCPEPMKEARGNSPVLSSPSQTCPGASEPEPPMESSPRPVRPSTPPLDEPEIYRTFSPPSLSDCQDSDRDGTFRDGLSYLAEVQEDTSRFNLEPCASAPMEQSRQQEQAALFPETATKAAEPESKLPVSDEENDEPRELFASDSEDEADALRDASWEGSAPAPDSEPASFICLDRQGCFWDDSPNSEILQGAGDAAECVAGSSIRAAPNRQSQDSALCVGAEQTPSKGYSQDKAEVRPLRSSEAAADTANVSEEEPAATWSLFASDSEDEVLEELNAQDASVLYDSAPEPASCTRSPQRKRPRESSPARETRQAALGCASSSELLREREPDASSPQCASPPGVEEAAFVASNAAPAEPEWPRKRHRAGPAGSAAAGTATAQAGTSGSASAHHSKVPMAEQAAESGPGPQRAAPQEGAEAKSARLACQQIHFDDDLSMFASDLMKQTLIDAQKLARDAVVAGSLAGEITVVANAVRNSQLGHASLVAKISILLNGSRLGGHDARCLAAGKMDELPHLRPAVVCLVAQPDEYSTGSSSGKSFHNLRKEELEAFLAAKGVV